MIQQIKEKAKELLDSGAVSCVIGYERASDGLTARPLFVYEAEDVDRLIFDETCTHNLVKYLLNRKDKPTAIVVKPCDARALNVLLAEKQLQRENVFVIGVACPGVVETGWNKKGDKLEARCQVCTQHTPPVYDFLVGEPIEEPSPPSTFPDVADLEGKSAAERARFWAEQFERCIRCYACRNVCPGCYCTECLVEQVDPEWASIRLTPEENLMWHVMRAFHLAGRCVGCNECERVCPVNIPLSLLNRKLQQEVLALFDFQAGLGEDAQAPLATFKKDEKLGIGEWRE